MKVLIKDVIRISLFVSIFLAIIGGSALATASFNANAGTSMNVGGTENLSISTSGCAGKFSVSSSNSDVVSVSSSSTFVDGNVMSNPSSIVLTAKSAGTATITITATDVSDTGYNDITGSKTVIITVTAPTPAPVVDTNTPAPVVKSSNTNLKNLGIKPNDFSGFTASKTDYYVTVPNEVSSVDVYAYKAETTQSISGTGNKTLEVGNNNCKVIVTAENGATKTYSIHITRKVEETETVPNVVEEPEQLLKLATLEVKNATITPEFNPDVYEYEINLTDSSIEKLDIFATANIENASIEVTGNENFMEGDNTVSIVLKSEDGTKAATYKIIVTKGVATEGLLEEANEENAEQPKEEKKNPLSFINGQNKGMIIILAIAIVVLLASIATVIVIIVKNRKEAKAEIMSFTPSSEYNVFKEKKESKDEKIENIEEEAKREKRKGKHF